MLAASFERRGWRGEGGVGCDLPCPSFPWLILCAAGTNKRCMSGTMRFGIEKPPQVTLAFAGVVEERG